MEQHVLEHRWSVRKPVNGGAVVECARTGRIDATLRDISLGGVRVDTGHVALPIKTRVSIGFHLIADDPYSWYRMSAVVVRNGDSGTAMIFLDCEGETFRALRAALYDRSLPRSPLTTETLSLAGANPPAAS
jgi:hypothetical protein